jgi:ATP-dependent Lon protease
VGGEILFIEATRMNGKGNLVLTGQLGDVMKESAQAALSFIRAHSRWLGLDDSFLERSDIHLHIPSWRHSQGWPVGGRDHVRVHGVHADRQARAQRCGHDG